MRVRVSTTAAALLVSAVLPASLAVGTVATVAPAVAASAPAATTCADWKPNVVNQLLCNLRLIGTPPALPTTAPIIEEPPVTEPEPNPDPAAEGCGTPVAKAGGGNWDCTFSDNFSGTALDRSKWYPQTVSFKSGSDTDWACYVDSSDVLGVSDGSLKLRVVKDATASNCPSNQNKPTKYRTASVSTFHLFSQQYGRFEARIKSQATDKPGLQEAFWLWPDTRFHDTSTWPLSGEIDIAETYSQYPNLALPFFHYSADILGPKPGLNTAYCAADRGVWNTYTLEWSANRLEMFVNGTSCLVNTSGDAAFKKRYIIALTQLLGVGGNAVTAQTPLPAQTEVDYVRVWK